MSWAYDFNDEVWGLALGDGLSPILHLLLLSLSYEDQWCAFFSKHLMLRQLQQWLLVLPCLTTDWVKGLRGNRGKFQSHQERRSLCHTELQKGSSLLSLVSYSFWLVLALSFLISLGSIYILECSICLLIFDSANLRKNNNGSRGKSLLLIALYR